MSYLNIEAELNCNISEEKKTKDCEEFQVKLLSRSLFLPFVEYFISFSYLVLLFEAVLSS